MKKNIWETLAEKTFDLSDTPQEPAPAKRKGPPATVPVRRDPAMANRGHAYNPGMPPQKNEDVPPAPGTLAKGRASGANAAYSRSKSPTMPMIPAVPPQSADPALPAGSPTTWEVSNTKGELFRVQANSAEEARQLMMDYMADERARQGIKGQLHPDEFKVRPAQVAGEGVQEGTTGASGAGFQLPIGDAAAAGERTYYKEALEQVFIETVRKLPNGKYGVYLKNKGKKKAPKKVGEYPDRVAAREAELARGGKSGDSAKKEREKLNRLKKDPKKLQAAKKRDAKSKKESIVTAMVDGLNEALFREEDVPGSTWDERLAGLSPTALASNKKLMGHTKNIHKASVSSLMDAHKLLAKALKKHGKVHAGEIGTETGGKMYMPCMLQHKDGDEHGPIYLYVDGGHVKMETDGQMDESLDGLDEGEGHRLRGALQAFQEKQLPRIDGARQAVAKRDADLDRMEKEHDEELSGRDGLSLHMLKQLIGQKHGRRYR